MSKPITPSKKPAGPAKTQKRHVAQHQPHIAANNPHPHANNATPQPVQHIQKKQPVHSSPHAAPNGQIDRPITPAPRKTPVISPHSQQSAQLAHPLHHHHYQMNDTQFTQQLHQQKNRLPSQNRGNHLNLALKSTLGLSPSTTTQAAAPNSKFHNAAATTGVPASSLAAPHRTTVTQPPPASHATRPPSASISIQAPPTPQGVTARRSVPLNSPVTSTSRSISTLRKNILSHCKDLPSAEIPLEQRMYIQRRSFAARTAQMNNYLAQDAPLGNDQAKARAAEATLHAQNVAGTNSNPILGGAGMNYNAFKNREKYTKQRLEDDVDAKEYYKRPIQGTHGGADYYSLRGSGPRPLETGLSFTMDVQFGSEITPQSSIRFTPDVEKMSLSEMERRLNQQKAKEVANGTYLGFSQNLLDQINPDGSFKKNTVPSPVFSAKSTPKQTAVPGSPQSPTYRVSPKVQSQLNTSNQLDDFLLNANAKF